MSALGWLVVGALFVALFVVSAVAMGAREERDALKTQIKVSRRTNLELHNENEELRRDNRQLEALLEQQHTDSAAAQAMLAAAIVDRSLHPSHPAGMCKSAAECLSTRNRLVAAEQQLVEEQQIADGVIPASGSDR